MANSFRTSAFLMALGAVPSLLAQAPDQSVLNRIKDEGLNHSQLMPTLSYLSDVIGERLTGSPSLKRANEWTRDTLTKWGLQNAHLEPWGPFGRGWQLDRFSAEVVGPYDIPLISYPKAWSPSLSHPVTADVVLVDVSSIDDLRQFKGKLRGKIVLNGGERPIAPHFTSQGSRYTDAELQAMADAGPQTPGGGNRRPPQGTPGQNPANNFRAQAALNGEKLRFFMEEGAAAVLDESRGDDGTLFVQSASVPPPPAPPTPPAGSTPAAGADAQAPVRRPVSVWDRSAPKTVPQITVSSEQYNRMVRMIKFGTNLKMSVDLKCSFYDKDPMAYNTVAEIPGSDLKDQVVMVGGHMDSWHSGTGATDNGAGVAVAMEAVRILQALNLKPRRTIRVALWSGEEEGLFGSRSYVSQHLGEFPAVAGAGGPGSGVPFGGGQTNRGPLSKKAEWDKVSGYFNLDNGTGKIRGIYLQGNDKVGPIFSDWLAPFKDMGASTVTIRNTGSTDHVSFDAVGVPGFQFIQDVIEYDSRTHHSNQDVFDRVQGDDLRQASVIMAWFLYNTAQRDEMLPRKPLAGS